MPLPIRLDRRENGSAIGGRSQAVRLWPNDQPADQCSGPSVDDMNITSTCVGLPEKLATRFLRACAR